MSELEADDVALTDGWAGPVLLGREPGSLALRGSPGVRRGGPVGESTVSPFRDVPLT